MRTPFIAGNWKMNTDSHISVELTKAIVEEANDHIADGKLTVALCPPFVYLSAVSSVLSASSIGLGAQNVYFESNGAFTGEVSVSMLKDIGCTYVLCGHSERRHVLNESDDIINRKVSAALSGGLLPILCVGELLQEREAAQTETVVESQLKCGLAGIDAAKMAGITIAYEPVWAIGTGLTATPSQAQEVHAFIRHWITQTYSAELSQDIRIQYGGSVKPDNAQALMALEDIDGLLVGGASLKAKDFLSILSAAN